MPEYRTIPNVELATVGMDWPASTGDVTLTFEHLADAMTAGNEDPHIKAARVKVGHTDPRFNDGAGDHDPFYDGEPALGKIANLRLANEGAVLVGDLINVPAWLADAAYSAYPNRSIENAWSASAGWDVTTPGGKSYSFVLTAVALLGLAMPAVMDLEDLGQLLTEGATLSQISDGDLAQAAVAAAAAGAVDAAADIDKVIYEFWNQVAIDDRYWWWPRSLWTDPNEIIADDDEGGLARVPFTSDDQGNVSFDDPVPVRETFVDVASGEPVAAAKRGDARPQRVFASRGEAETTQPEGREKPARAQAKEDDVDDQATIDLQALRQRLGLPEDATEEQINEALATEEPQASEPEGTEGETTEPAAEVTEPEAVAASETTIAVDKGVWEQTQRQAADGAAARAEQLTEHRETILAAAVKAGKITPASKDAWRTKLVSAPEATEAELEALPSGLVPVDEKGVAALSVGDGYPEMMKSAFGVDVSRKD